MADRNFLFVFVFVTWSVSNKKPLGFIFFEVQLLLPCLMIGWGKTRSELFIGLKRGAAVKLGGTKLAGKELREPDRQ
jgi:hypothetical protein